MTRAIRSYHSAMCSQHNNYQKTSIGGHPNPDPTSKPAHKCAYMYARSYTFTCNVPHTLVSHISMWATNSQIITICITHAMTPPNNAQLSSNEGDSLLAIQAIRLGQIPSVRQAIEQYNVLRATLSRRMNGTRSKRDSSIGTQRLTLSEEKVLV